MKRNVNDALTEADILKTIDDWRVRYGLPAANSALTRGYVYELLGTQRSGGTTR